MTNPPWRPSADRSPYDPVRERRAEEAGKRSVSVLFLLALAFCGLFGVGARAIFGSEHHASPPDAVGAVVPAADLDGWTLTPVTSDPTGLHLMAVKETSSGGVHHYAIGRVDTSVEATRMVWSDGSTTSTDPAVFAAWGRGADAVFVVGTDRMVVARRWSDGARVWEADVGAPIRRIATVQGRIVVTTTEAVRGLAPRDGSMFWERTGVSVAVPAGPDADVMVMQGTDGGTLSFADPAHGTTLTTIEPLCPARVEEVRLRRLHEPDGDPAKGSLLWYQPGASACAGVVDLADGSVRWRGNLDLRGAAGGVDAIGPHHLVAGTASGNLLVVDLDTGRTRPIPHPAGVVVSPRAVAADLVVVDVVRPGRPATGGLAGLDLASGAVRWRTQLPSGKVAASIGAGALGKVADHTGMPASLLVGDPDETGFIQYAFEASDAGLLVRHLVGAPDGPTSEQLDPIRIEHPQGAVITVLAETPDGALVRAGADLLFLSSRNAPYPA